MLIAHASDLHINSGKKYSNIEKTEYLLKKIVSDKPDHIIISGDLVDNADYTDFELTKSIFKKMGIYHPDRLTIVIGNHDLFGGVQSLEDVLLFPTRCANTNYLNQVKLFNESFSELFTNTLYKSPNNNYPFAKDLGDTLLVGLNSIAEYSKIHNPFASNGFINKSQKEELRLICTEYGSSYKNKLIVMHHHALKVKETATGFLASMWLKVEGRTMKLRKRKKVIALFEELGINAVLHGHIHDNHNTIENGIHYINSGGSILSRMNDFLNYNLIKLDHNSIKVEPMELFPVGIKQERRMKRESLKYIP